MKRCSSCGGDLPDVPMLNRASGVGLEEPLIAHPQCCYFDGAQGTIGCQSEVDTPRPYWRKL
jgi:hypothetical protein